MKRNFGMKRNLTDPFNIILHPWVTEKTLQIMEEQNKLDFVVNRRATKADVIWAVEQLYNAKAERVTTRIMKEGKHAVVKFAKGYSAEEIGMNIGIL